MCYFFKGLVVDDDDENDCRDDDDDDFDYDDDDSDNVVDDIDYNYCSLLFFYSFVRNSV